MIGAEVGQRPDSALLLGGHAARQALQEVVALIEARGGILGDGLLQQVLRRLLRLAVAGDDDPHARISVDGHALQAQLEWNLGFILAVRDDRQDAVFLPLVLQARDQGTLEGRLVRLAKQVHERLADQFLLGGDTEQGCPRGVHGDDDALVDIGDGLRGAGHQAAQLLLVLPGGAEYPFEGEPEPMRVQFAANDGAQPVAVGEGNDVPRTLVHGGCDAGLIHPALHEQEGRWRRAQGDCGDGRGEVCVGLAVEEQHHVGRGGLQLVAERREVVDPQAVHRMAAVPEDGIDRRGVIVTAADDDQRNTNRAAQLHTCRDPVTERDSAARCAGIM